MKDITGFDKNLQLSHYTPTLPSNYQHVNIYFISTIVVLKNVGKQQFHFCQTAKFEGLDNNSVLDIIGVVLGYFLHTL